MSDFRLIIEKHGCHSLKSFGHGIKSVAYPFEVEKSIKRANCCVALSALVQQHAAVHSIPGVNDVFVQFANMTSDFLM